jgi:hypothetical protein
VTKRAIAHRAGLTAFRQGRYLEARRNFGQAIRYGLDDQDVLFKVSWMMMIVMMIAGDSDDHMGEGRG